MKSIDQLRSYQPLLFLFAFIGLVGLNGVFLYYFIAEPEIMQQALRNPISLIFILEAFLMMGIVAWLISQFEMKKPGWLIFVVMSFIGGLVFSVPAFLLIHFRKNGRENSPVDD